MNRFASSIIRYRYYVIAAVMAITLFMLYALKDLRVNADVLSYLPDNDPSAQLFTRIGDVYGGNSMVIIGFSGQDVFETETLEIIRALTDSVRSVAGIGYVTSLTNVIDIRGDDYGIEIGRLVDEYDIPTDRATLDSLKTYALSKSMYRGNLVSEDATATLIAGKILNGYDHDNVVGTIREKLDALPYSGNIHYGGMPVTLHELNSNIVRDMSYISPLAFIVISLVLLAGFRSLRGVLLPMSAVLMAVIWTLGSITLLGYEITMLTNTIPVILLAVGSAYAIHVVNAILTEQHRNPEKALQRAVSYVVVPVILASATTMLGFTSFIAGSYLMMIREFGLFSALGILFALLLAITYVPATMAILKNKPLNTQKQEKILLFDKFAKSLSSLILHHKKTLLTCWVVIILISIAGTTRIERRVDLVDYFKKDNIVRKGEDLLKEKFNGSTPLYVNISGNIQHPDLLNMMEFTQDFMAGFDYIPYSQSAADLIKQMNDVMGEGEAIPDDETKIIQLWFLLDGQEIMEQLVSPDLSEGIIQAYVNSNELHVLREIEDNFATFVEQHSTDDYELAFTGIPVMLKRLDDSIIRSQTYSLLIAMILVILMVSALLRSFRKGLTAVIPIGITVIVLFGLMGLTGTPLDIATVLTGSVSIGIGIDYAIHFISRFGEGMKMRLSQEESLERSIRTSGRAIVINMLSVSLGFAMLSFSNLVPLQRFGFLIAATMIVAGMASLTLLPLVLVRR